MCSLPSIYFTPLGQGGSSFPHPHPFRAAHVAENMEYCKSELERLDASIAWIHSELTQIRLSVSLRNNATRQGMS